MEKNRFSKPVAFNRNNESDKKILDHVKRRNFSGYVKKLILADIALKEATKVTSEKNKNEQVSSLETAEEKLARMQEQLKKRSNNVSGNSDSSSDT